MPFPPPPFFFLSLFLSQFSPPEQKKPRSKGRINILETKYGKGWRSPLTFGPLNPKPSPPPQGFKHNATPFPDPPPPTSNCVLHTTVLFPQMCGKKSPRRTFFFFYELLGGANFGHHDFSMEESQPKDPPPRRKGEFLSGEKDLFFTSLRSPFQVFEKQVFSPLFPDVKKMET